MGFLVKIALPNFNFNPFLEGMHRELKAYGFDVDVTIQEKNLESSVWSAFLKRNTLSLMLAISEKID